MTTLQSAAEWNAEGCDCPDERRIVQSGIKAWPGIIPPSGMTGRNDDGMTMKDYGIVGFGAYVPRLRLDRAAIADAHKWMNPSLRSAAKGFRAFAGWDEDPITMAVEAGRAALGDGDRGAIAACHIASTTFPYADLSNAVIVGSALGLADDIVAANAAGSQRAGTTALREVLTAARDNALVIASERPVTAPASVAELQTGAGAAALKLGHDGVIARFLGAASRSVHFVDHFRATDHAVDYGWEERWVRDEGYAKILPPTVAAALADAGVDIAAVDFLVFPSMLKGVVATIAKQIGFGGTIVGGFEADVGYCGVAQGFLMLCSALEQCRPGQRIMMIGFGQGADVLLFEATDGCATYTSARGASAAAADRNDTSDYLRLLSFYDQIPLDWGMRSEKLVKAIMTEQYRNADQIDNFTGGQCGQCGTPQFPVLNYCVNPSCGAPASGFAPISLADQPARIFTVTTDWLSYHPAPPLALGFVQFDIGARLMMEIVDARPDELEVGTRLKMMFRIKDRDRVRGINRYFWKAAPFRAAGE
jgi:3-hydroxy-3-methylglutaryl CoA synthase